MEKWSWAAAGSFESGVLRLIQDGSGRGVRRIPRPAGQNCLFGSCVFFWLFLNILSCAFFCFFKYFFIAFCCFFCAFCDARFCAATESLERAPAGGAFSVRQQIARQRMAASLFITSQ